MNIPKYKLFRCRIQAWERKYSGADIREEDTHIISIEVEYNGDKFASHPMSIEPTFLKFTIKSMKGAIISVINQSVGKGTITSIG